MIGFVAKETMMLGQWGGETRKFGTLNEFIRVKSPRTITKLTF